MESAVKASEMLEGKEVYNRALRLDYSVSASRQNVGGGRGDRGDRAPRDRAPREERGSSF